MKEVLLILIQDCKWHIAISVGFLVVAVLGIYTARGFINLEYVLVSLICYIFFVATLWNTRFVYTPSVDENSNGAAIISRWGVILVSLCTLLYVLFNPLYVN